MPTLPDTHKKFLETALSSLKHDPRILGVAAGGSYLLDELDAYSDLDLVIYVEAQRYPEVLGSATTIAQQLGSLIECFTGEHVGEPRLLICLYGPPLLHIDLKFVSLDDIHEKVENPVILWERDELISSQIFKTPAEFPQPDPTWIESRFWTWIHYTATKIGRGELFEAVEAIGFLRVNVLGPLVLVKHAARPQGLRKLEFIASEEELEDLKKTIPSYDSRDCVRALRSSVDLYRQLRNHSGNVQAERLALEYLDQIDVALV